MTTEELQVIISAEIKDLKQGVEEATKEIKKFSKDGDSNFKKFGNAVKTAGKAVGTAMKAVTGAVAAGATALVALSESTKELRVNQAKLNTAFITAGSSAEQAAETYNDLYRVLGDDDVATEAAGHLAKLTTNQEDLAEWTNICQGVYATFGDSLPIEGLTEAANETAKVGSLTGSLADALNWAGVNEEEFQAKLDACNTEAEREALIRETLNGLYSEAAAQYEEQADSILRANEAQAQLNTALATLGEAVTPIVTIFKEFGAQILSELVPGLTQMIEGIQGIIEGTEGASAIFEEGLGNVLDTLLSRFTEALPQVLEIGIQLITTVIEGILQYLPEVITTVIGVIPQITEAIINLLPQLIEVGVQLIVSIIEGLSETVPQLIEQVVEILPEIINTLVDAIPQLLEAAIEFFMAIVEAIPEIIPDLIDALPEIIDNILDMLIENLPLILEAGIELFLAIVDAIPQIIPSLVEAIPQIITSIITAIIKAIPQILAAGVQLFLAIPASLLEIIPNLINAFGEIKENVKEYLVEKLQDLMDFDWSLPKLKLPKVEIKGKFSLSPLQVPTFSIKWNAKGGVFDEPSLFFGNGGLQGLGEDGAEAVVPLEKNTEWMNVLANKLSERMGGNTPIYLQVDGKTFAQIACDSINQLTRQRGALPLNMY